MSASVLNVRSLASIMEEIADLQNVAAEKKEELTEALQNLKEKYGEIKDFVNSAEAEIEEIAHVEDFKQISPLAPKQRPNYQKPTQKKLQKQRNYGQQFSLPEVLWSALDRDPSTYKTILNPVTRKHIFTDYPDNAVGLKISEIREIIKAERKWRSSSNDITPQLQQALGKLRYEGKISRNQEDRRYFVVEGAELYGPPINEDGSPMILQEDGTFLTSKGKVFCTPKGHPIRRRSKS